MPEGGGDTTTDGAVAFFFVSYMLINSIMLLNVLSPTVPTSIQGERGQEPIQDGVKYLLHHFVAHRCVSHHVKVSEVTGGDGVTATPWWPTGIDQDSVDDGAPAQSFAVVPSTCAQ